MKRNLSEGLLVVFGGSILGFALIGVTMTVMQSLVTNDWGNWVLVELVVLIVLTAIAAAILGGVFGNYSYNDRRDGDTVAKEDVASKSDDMS